MHAIIKDKWKEIMNGGDMREIQNTIDRIKRRDTSVFLGKDGSNFKYSHTISPNSQR